MNDDESKMFEYEIQTLGIVHLGRLGKPHILFSAPKAEKEENLGRNSREILLMD